MKIDTETAAKGYDILIDHAGASSRNGEKEAFVQAVCSDAYPASEYRFMGSLGFGGKFRNNRFETPYVDCYPEHLTDARRETIAIVNARLADLLADISQHDNDNGGRHI